MAAGNFDVAFEVTKEQGKRLPPSPWPCQALTGQLAVPMSPFLLANSFSSPINLFAQVNFRANLPSLEMAHRNVNPIA